MESSEPTAGDALRLVNPAQIASLVRTLAQAASAITGWAFLNNNNVITAASTVVFGLVTLWGLWARSDKNLLKSAEEVPAVKTLVVSPTVPMATDPDHPKIVPPASAFKP